MKIWPTIDPEVIVLKGPEEPVLSVAYSPDVKTFAAACGARYVKGRPGEIKIWSAVTRRLVHSLKGHNRAVTGVAYSPDGRFLASASEDKTVKTWDIATGAEKVACTGHGAEVNSIAYSPDGEKLVSSGGNDNTVRIWDASSGKQIASLTAIDSFRCALFGGKGEIIYAGGTAGVIRRWDTATGESLPDLEGHADDVRCLAISRDGTMLASGSDDQTVRLWDVASGKELRAIEGHRRSINSVAFSPDGQRVLSGGGTDGKGDAQCSIKVWDVRTGQEVLTLPGHKSWVNGVVFSPDGLRIASGGRDHFVKIWEAARRPESRSFPKQALGILSLAFDGAGKHLAAACGRMVQFWDLKTGTRYFVLRSNMPVRRIVISKKGKLLGATSLVGGQLTVWDYVARKVLWSHRQHGSIVYGIAFSPDGKRLASAGNYRALKVWDAVTGKQVFWHKPPEDFMQCAFSPDAKLLACSDSKGRIQMWDAKTWKKTRSWQAHRFGAESLAFSPDGTRLVSSSLHSHEVKVWNCSDGKSLLTFEDRAGPTGAAISPDGKYVAVSSQGSAVKVWSIGNGRLMATFERHSHKVNCVAFSSDGQWLASGSNDQTVQIHHVGNARASEDLIDVLAGNRPDKLDVQPLKQKNKIDKVDEKKIETTRKVFIPTFSANHTEVPYATDLVGPDKKGAVVRIDPQTKKAVVVSTGKFISAPNGLAVSSNGKTLFVANSNGNIVELNPDTKKESLIADGLGYAGDLAVGPGGDELFITQRVSGQVIRLSRRTKRSTVVAKGLSNPQGIVFDPVNNEVLVAEINGSRITRINIKTGAKSVLSDNSNKYGNLLANPFDLEFTKDGKLAIADQHAGTNTRDGGLTMIDPVTGRHISGSYGQRIIGPLALAVRSDGSFLLAIDGHSAGWPNAGILVIGPMGKQEYLVQGGPFRRPTDIEIFRQPVKKSMK